MTQQVWLGLAGDLVSPDDSVDYFTTRVGGAAVLPGSEFPAEALSGCSCSLCGQQLSLVLQAYAPHPDAPERVLMVFGCTKLGCGKEAGSYKALRCQIPPTSWQQQQQQESHIAEQYTAQPPAAPAPPAAEAAAGFDAFAAAADAWGDAGDWGAPSAAAAAGTATDAFDFSDLTESLEAAGQQQQQAEAAAIAAKPKSKQSAVDGDSTAWSSVVCCRASAWPMLPEFYVYAELEPDDTAAKTISSRELQHVQQLLAAYEAESAAAAGSSSTGTSSSTPQPAAAAEADGEEGSWVGEGYEKDELRGVERSYLKFSKRLARQFQQCARYCLNGPLLWPKSTPPQPRQCPHCGGPRVFELQLMPALIQLAIEAAQMALEQDLQVNAAVVDAVANWDWATIAVFTCQASCTHSREGSRCEALFEEVALINEQDCHIALPPPVAGMAAAAAGASATAAIVSGKDQVYADETAVNS